MYYILYFETEGNDVNQTKFILLLERINIYCGENGGFYHERILNWEGCMCMG